MHTASPQQNILAELDRELAVTRQVLERVPDDKFDYQPHPKSMKLGQLASHVVNLLLFNKLFVEADQRDFDRLDLDTLNAHLDGVLGPMLSAPD